VDWRDRSRGAFPTFAAFWLVYWLWISDFRSGPPPTGSIFIFLTAAFLMFLGWISWRRRQDLLLLALNGAVYFGVSYDLLRKEYEPWLGLFAVAVAGAHLAVAFVLWRSLPREDRDTRPVLLALGIALTFLTLAAPIQFAGYRITMAWAVEVAG
jgi:UDP-N-acetylmuramyl pentapeptide phosphotransferase/UDP-N-acetylglucosamine-1-phosphate transferase